MPLADTLYEWLRQGPTPDCDEILAAGIEHAAPPWDARIVRVLLERGHPASWAGLICALDRLPAEIRKSIFSDEAKLTIGIDHALKSRSAAARLNALAAFEQASRVRITYRLSDLLRDPAAEVRAVAARILRSRAVAVRRDPPAAPHEPPGAAARSDRQELVPVIQEALRTFDLHHRLEALEIALWFASDVGDTLWPLLENHKSRAGVLVAEHLVSWNSPWLAGFLVAGLERSAWRNASIELLRGWKTPEHLIELLRVTHLLENPEIATHLASVRGAPVFCEIDPTLAAVSPDLRPCVPRWFAALGLREDPWIERLARWSESPDAALQRAAVYALASIDAPEAVAALRAIAERRSPLAAFARWCVLARDASLVPRREPSLALRAQRGCRPRVAPDAEPDVDHDFATLWQACRRCPAAERTALLDVIREHADAWKPRLRILLQSPDARDRVLVLQVVATRDLARIFRHDVQRLLDDPVPGIRQLAGTVLNALPPTRTLPEAGSDAASVAVAPGDGAADRHELDQLMAQLAASRGSAGDELLVARIRQLMRRVRGAAQRAAEEVAS